MSDELGCDPEYEITVTYRGGSKVLAGFKPERVQWGRAQDNWSEARIDLPADCCGKLEQVRSWAHELHVSRNGNEVWCGPIFLPTFCRGGNILIARDVLWWLGRRRLHQSHVSAAQGAVSIARELIIDGFLPDDPNILAHLDAVGVGVISDREYLADGKKYVIDLLKDLAKGSIDFTALGRRIIVRPQGTSLGRTTMLTCNDFQGDVCATDNGQTAATSATVTGKDGVIGTSGGVDPFYGLVEVLIDDQTITSNATAAGQAAGLVAAGNPPPLVIQPPDSASLSPDAPVSIEQLVPGVEVPVFIDCTCRQANQLMRLIKLNVTWQADSDLGEQVRPILQPVTSSVVD